MQVISGRKKRGNHYESCCVGIFGPPKTPAASRGASQKPKAKNKARKKKPKMTTGIQSSGGCHLIVFVLGACGVESVPQFFSCGFLFFECCTAEILGNESNLTLLRFFLMCFF